MKLGILSAAALAAPVCLLAAEHTDQWQKTFAVTPGSRLEVRNINGNIRVTTDSGNAIRVAVREQYGADSAEELAELRKHVYLSTKQEGPLVRLAVEHPHGDNRHHHSGDWRFRHEFELHVPRDLELSLHTINGGEVHVAGAAGKWELKNINGAVTLTDTSGHGLAETINGAVSVSFVSNPSQPSTFKTLNGAIDVSFQPNLSADVIVSTMHGEAYTDFDYDQGLSGGMVEREGNRYRLSDRRRRLRIGGGGPEHQFKTLNGSIKIRKYGKQG